MSSFLQESARRIGKVSEEAKLEIDVETYVESFRPHIMDVVFAWANGASFSQICKMTDVFEGNYVVQQEKKDYEIESEKLPFILTGQY